MKELVNKLISGNDEVVRQQYEALVVAEIRKKYSQNDENAILRKKLAGLDTEEFETYNAYVEECKSNAKNILGL